jgi:hypothetical protein
MIVVLLREAGEDRGLHFVVLKVDLPLTAKLILGPHALQLFKR